MRLGSMPPLRFLSAGSALPGPMLPHPLRTPRGAARPTADAWHALFPNHYAWFLLVAALDLFCTYLILNPYLFPDLSPPPFGDAGRLGREVGIYVYHILEPRPGGEEANAIAAWILGRFGFGGLVVFKFAITTFVIGICEIVGRSDRLKGRQLAAGAIAISSVPVVFGIGQMISNLRMGL